MTDTDLHARASELFVELRVLPPAERAAALSATAARDPRLAAEVTSLLAHDGDDGIDAALPGSIGPYRVLSRIGSGGSGQVFLAEQEQPVRRRVAIKVVPLAAVSPELAARFDVERRALESTDHPHIARILDAGRTADGLPYIVMNFVPGEPITDHCVRRAVPLADRIGLLLDVAGAVQHAHQRGVIHRDLKPANILVTEVDGRPVPQVLDFGIAKPVGGALLAESPPTLGLPMGTPGYMAPEQTGTAAVDTRADVYALGALLYELVAGRPPIDATGDPLESLRRIREVVPPPVSRALADGSPRAAPGPAARALLADLDVILGKALEKSPERRYASVDALGDDLRRLQRCEPIAARPPTRRYRAARFAQRNRGLVAAAIIVLAALGIGVTGLATGLREARQQRAQAVTQRDKQQEINRFLIGLLASVSPEEAGKDAKVIDLLDRASLDVDERFAGRPLVAAAIHYTLGMSYTELGELDQAQRHLERALTLQRAAAGADSPDTVHTEIALASLVGRRQSPQAAEAALAPLIGRARLVLGPDDPELYSALNDLGVALAASGRNGEALAALHEALDGRRRLLDPHSYKVVMTLNNLAELLDAQGDTAGSIAMLREVLELVKASRVPQPYSLLGLENNIGAGLQDLGRNDEAEPYLRDAARLATELLGAGHPSTLLIESNLASLQADVGHPVEAGDTFRRVIDAQTEQLGPGAADTLSTRHGWCSALRKAGRVAEAAAGFESLLNDVTAALGADHALAAQTELSLASALLALGQPEPALAHGERAESRLRALYGADNPRTASAAKVVSDARGQLAAAPGPAPSNGAGAPR